VRDVACKRHIQKINVPGTLHQGNEGNEMSVIPATLVARLSRWVTTGAR
jgi:hypothetical protein